MANDSGWVFDSLVGFLQGPIWSAPLLTFIEERSLIFETDTEDSDEYREAYQEYKNLVDLLLGSYMEDMGISPEQFEYACTVNRQTKLPIHFQQSLFEQIWAANEYEIFKRMMIQKNLELQLQALNMLEQRFGLTPASLTCGTDNLGDDELVMEELINKQIAGNKEEEEEEDIENKTDADFEKEHERLTHQYQNERAALEEALRATADISTSSIDESNETDEQRDNTLSYSNAEPFPLLKKLEKLTPLGPIQKKKEEENKEKERNKKETESETKEKTQENQDDIKKREYYLKARRDKLVALKKKARNQRLEMSKARPSSARNVAEATMKGKQDLENPQVPDSSILQVRKALAARLKAEVVGR
ncbi:cilia- and flagella-associated protein 36 [Chelonus insularis]|uniref:cilia- and flagella-associated protein 36 n=1 Tax=Chelonus insularis TaxID=460826 RepID=UPI00158F062C|nr:cilia- and flagella-associated protein 36 [Chelonus insularis]